MFFVIVVRVVVVVAVGFMMLLVLSCKGREPEESRALREQSFAFFFFLHFCVPNHSPVKHKHECIRAGLLFTPPPPAPK